MNLENRWNTTKVAMDCYGFLDEPGALYTEGLGPCIGICLAYNCWAGIIHSSHPPHDEKEIGELIAEAKRVIPAEKLSLVRPVLCGSDPNCEDEDDDPDAYEQERLHARSAALKFLEEAGFGEPYVHWSSSGETAAVCADLEALKVLVEIDHKDFTYPILQA